MRAFVAMVLAAAYAAALLAGATTHPSFADADMGDDGPPFFGSAAGLALHAPVVGIAAAPSGSGYWLVAADGGVFAFGDAPFLGSTGGLPLNDTVVGMAPTAEGHGYVLVARDGGVFAFGDARYFPGSSAGRPIVAASANGIGVLLVRADGSTLEGIGEAVVAGSGVAGSALDGRIVAAAAAPPLGSENVWLVTPAGDVIGVGGGPYVLTR